MSADIAGLQSAIANFTTNIKTAIAGATTLSIAQVDALVDQMKAQFDAEALAQGVGGPAPVVSAILEKYLPLAANNIDCDAANHFSKTITGATTLTVSNVAPAGRVTTLVLHLTNPGANVTFWSGVKWSGGVKPTLSAAGRDVLAFSTVDGGVTWDGYVIGQDMKAAA